MFKIVSYDLKKKEYLLKNTKTGELKTIYKENISFYAKEKTGK